MLKEIYKFIKKEKNFLIINYIYIYIYITIELWVSKN